MHERRSRRTWRKPAWSSILLQRCKERRALGGCAIMGAADKCAAGHVVPGFRTSNGGNLFSWHGTLPTSVAKVISVG